MSILFCTAHVHLSSPPPDCKACQASLDAIPLLLRERDGFPRAPTGEGVMAKRFDELRKAMSPAAQARAAKGTAALLKDLRRITVVVMGFPAPMAAHVTEKIHSVIARAVEAAGSTPLVEYELRSQDGHLFDPGTRVGDNKILDGATVYLNPRAGVGACPAEPGKAQEP